MLQESTRNNKFPKKLRILKRRDFLFVQNKKGVFHNSMLVIVAPKGLNYPRFGVVVSKKIGNAVVRNYYKRIFRGYFRCNKELFRFGYDYVVIARKDILKYSFDELHKVFLMLVESSNEKIIDKSN